MKKTKVTVHNATIEIPHTPNFLVVNGNVQSIAYLTKEALRKVAQAWTKELLEKAQEKFNRINNGLTP